MSERSPTPLTPRVPGTYRGKCDCNFWICTRAQLNRLRCPSCGAVVRHAKPEHFVNHGVVDTIAQVAPPRADKKKRTPTTTPTEQLDGVVDGATEARKQQMRRRQGAA